MLQSGSHLKTHVAWTIDVFARCFKYFQMGSIHGKQTTVNISELERAGVLALAADVSPDRPSWQEPFDGYQAG